MNINLFGDHNNTDFSFMLSQLGKTVTINNVSIQALITNTALEQNYDDKRITTLDSFNRGDSVIYNNAKYMVISEQNDKRYNKYKGIMRRLPFTIIFNHNCVYSYVDAYIESVTYGIKTNDFLSIATGTINVHMQDNEAASTIKLGDRFIVKSRPYKVTGIDKVDRKGICTITADVDSIDTATDDLINDVAGGKACTVTINTPDSLMESSQTLQLDYTAPANQTVLFESSKPSVATINTSGLITAIAEGTTTIKATLANNPQFTDSITVTVKLKDNYKINVTTNKASLLYNELANISVQVLNNGVATTQEAITYSVVYANMTTPVPSNIAELVNIQNRTVNVHNINTGIPEDIYLKVTLNKDTSVIGFVPLHLDYYRPVANTITISGSDNIYSQRTGTWTSTVNPNQEDVTWSLFADNQTSTTNKATIQSFTGTSVTLKAATVSTSVPAGYFQLKATLKSDNSIVAWYRIQLKSFL